MRRWALIFMFAIMGACTSNIGLAPPPNLYRAGTNYPEESVPFVLRTSTPRIMFMTDRVPERDNYGVERSPSMAFGSAVVRFGENLEWPELLERTRADSEQNISSLTVTDVQEAIRFTATPLPVERENGFLIHERETRAIYDEETRQFRAAVAAEIARTGNTSILVYIHGFNNSFNDGLTTLANLWHFSGRETTPISYSWPSGSGKGILGYFRDRDSATFSVHHAKEFIRNLAAIPEVTEIDIVAHSRGNDVATNALRELVIETRAAGLHPKSALKTGTLIMAAADLDIDIVRQRLQSERFAEAFEQVNLYVNPGDAALRASAFLTRSRRLGALNNKDFEDGELQKLREESLAHFIRVEDVRGGLGHAYFRNNPAVLSDVVLTLRTRAFPGGTLRPLDQDGNGVWVLHSNYPLERLPNLSIDEEIALANENR